MPYLLDIALATCQDTRMENITAALAPYAFGIFGLFALLVLTTIASPKVPGRD